jgi:hypothetical protein
MSFYMNLDLYKGFIDSHFPYLRIINSHAVFMDKMSCKIINSIVSGWTIHDYDEAIEIRSPYEEKGISEPMVLMLKEQIRVISEVMELVAYDKKWKAIELIEGTRMLQFILWVETVRYKLALRGYEPTVKELTWYSEIEEYACRNNIPFNKRVIKEDVPSKKNIADSRIWIEAATELKLH